jgi:hypothetical protein
VGGDTGRRPGAPSGERTLGVDRGPRAEGLSASGTAVRVDWPARGA